MRSEENFALHVERLLVSRVQSELVERLNRRVQMPNGPTMDGAPWMRATVLWDDPDDTRALGRNGYALVEGLLVIDCFDRIGAGTATVLAMAGEVIEVFRRGTQITDAEVDLTIYFRTPAPQAGSDDGRGFYQVAVQCPWFIYVHHSEA
jgi:hypothetical protein